MIAIIRGHIHNAWKANPHDWLYKLKQYFSIFGDYPSGWEIFGGNEFLIKIKEPEEALFAAFCIKAIFKQVAPLDVRLHLRVGEETQPSKEKIRENTGSAYLFESSQKGNLHIQTDNEDFDHIINLLLSLALLEMDRWSVVDAEIAELLIIFPEKSQQELADWLKIKQSAVSQRRKRIHFELLEDINAYFRKEISQIKK